MKLRVDIYFGTDHNMRGLVSVFDSDGKPIQTVGSAVVGSDELTTMIKAAQYTLNAFGKEKQNG